MEVRLMPRTLCVIALIAAGTSPLAAEAQSFTEGLPRYGVTVISTGASVASSGPVSQSLGLNNNGRVVGYFFSAPLQYKALNWKSGTAMQLGGLGGFDQTFANRVNLLGRVAGVGYKMNGGAITESHALKWTGGVMSDLGTLGGHHAAALAINDNDQIVGGSTLAGDLITRAFIYSNGAMTAITTLPGAVESYAYDISNTGYVVGTAVTATPAKPFIWRNGVSFALPVPAGVRAGAANAVNDSGIVAGSYEINQFAGSFAAVIWVNGQLLHLGYLGGALSYSVASDINSTAQVVGTTNSSAGFTGFLWKSGVMYDLRTLIAPAYGPLEITSAGAINDSGQIAAVATINGRQTAVLLTPAN
jgi:probable HAF family extracellular repeat protein